MGKKFNFGVKRGKVGNSFKVEKKGANIAKSRKNIQREYQSEKSANEVVDRRFGEHNHKISHDKKMLERFTRERVQSSRKKKALELDSDDEMLTHSGKLLEDDYQESEGRSDQENEPFITPKVQDEIVEKCHFGQGGEGQEESKEKSTEEIYKEIISKSKMYREERKRTKEVQQDRVEKLNQDFREIREIIDPNKSSKMKGRKLDEYDKLALEMQDAARFQPRQRSSHQIVEEKLQQLKQLQEEEKLESELSNSHLSQEYNTEIRTPYIFALPSTKTSVKKQLEQMNLFEMSVLMDRANIQYNPILNIQHKEALSTFLELMLRYLYFSPSCLVEQTKSDAKAYAIMLKSMYSLLQHCTDVIGPNLLAMIKEVTTVTHQKIYFFHFVLSTFRSGQKQSICELASVMINKLLYKNEVEDKKLLIDLGYVLFVQVLSVSKHYSPELMRVISDTLLYYAQNKKKLLAKIHKRNKQETKFPVISLNNKVCIKKILYLLSQMHKNIGSNLCRERIYTELEENVSEYIEDFTFQFIEEEDANDQKKNVLVAVQKFKEIKEIEPLILDKVTSTKQAKREASNRSLESLESEKIRKLYQKEKKQAMKELERDTSYLQELKKKRKVAEEQESLKHRKAMQKSLEECQQEYVKMRTAQPTQEEIDERKAIKNKRRKRKGE